VIIHELIWKAIMDFLPTAPVLLAYFGACLVLFITPGPDMSLFLSRTLSGGRPHGLASMLGSNLGCLGHTILASVGLTALLAASVTAFTILKIGGGLYLLWLAVDAIRNGSALSVSAGGKPPGSVMRTFWMGAAVNLTNPKVVLFFVTFLPQFVEANDPHAAQKIAFLGLMFVLVSIPPGIVMVLGAERLIGWLRQRPGILRVIDWSFAGIFGLFAVKILTTQNIR
jgi:threonine/homoserine/homoserine lactone efflux protein